MCKSKLVSKLTLFIQMNMKTNVISEKDFFKTADLALAGFLNLYKPLDSVEKSPNDKKSFFQFKRFSELDELIALFWRGEGRVDPAVYFQSLRLVKARLYDRE